MRLSSLFSACLVLTASLVSETFGKINRKTYKRDDDEILQLNDFNHVNALTQIKFIMVLIHQNDHNGKAALEEFKEAKKNLVNQCEDLDFGVVNVKVSVQFQKNFNIAQKLQVRIFKNKKHMKYHGELVAKHLITWAHQAMNVPIEINSASELEDLKKSVPVILGTFPGRSPEEEYRTFVEASENFLYDPKLELPRFAVITNSRVARLSGLAPGQVAVYQKFNGGKKVPYQGSSRNLKQFEEFLMDEAFPYVYNHNFEGIHRGIVGATYQHVFFMDPRDSSFEPTYKTYRDTAREYSKKNSDVAFVWADPNKVAMETLTGYFHIDPARDLPCTRMIHRDRFSSKFKPSRTDFSYSGVTRFVDDVIAGRVKRSIKSEMQPYSWDSGDVKIIVGTTYENFLYENKRKAVFMIYYGAGEKKSEAVMPQFEQAASDMRSNSSVVFGKLNVIENDSEVGLAIQFPTLVLHFPGGERKKIYNGEKFTSDEFIKFVKTAGRSTPPDAYEKMMVDLAEDMELLKAKFEREMIRQDEEREAAWKIEEEKLLKNAVHHEEGEEIQDLEEQKRWDMEHAHNPLEHDPEEHVDAAFAHSGL